MFRKIKYSNEYKSFKNKSIKSKECKRVEVKYENVKLPDVQIYKQLRLVLADFASTCPPILVLPRMKQTGSQQAFNNKVVILHCLEQF